MSELYEYFRKIGHGGEVFVGYSLSHEGLMIWQKGDRFYVASAERGHVINKKHFNSEGAAVAYLLQHISTI